MTFEYNNRFDILYVTFAKDEVGAQNIETNDGDVVRFSPETGTVLGLTIFAFMTRLKKGEQIAIPVVKG